MTLDQIIEKFKKLQQDNPDKRYDDISSVVVEVLKGINTEELISVQIYYNSLTL